MLDRNGNKRSGELYDSTRAKGAMEYNVENILNHLEYVTNIYYSNKTDSTSAVNSSRAINAIEDGLYESETQSDVANNTNAANSWGVGIGVGAGVVGAGISVGAGIANQGLKAAVGIVNNAWGGWGVAGMSAIGIGLGAWGGLAIGNQLVNGSIARYTNADGTFNSGKANCVKGLSGFTGAIVGWSLSNAIQSGGVSLWGLIPAGICGLITGLVHHFG